MTLITTIEVRLSGEPSEDVRNFALATQEVRVTTTAYSSRIVRMVSGNVPAAADIAIDTASLTDKTITNVQKVAEAADTALAAAASNTSTIANILSNFTTWVLGTYLGALTLLDAAVAAGESIQVMAGKLQGQVNAIKSRVGLLEDNVIADITISNTVSYVDITTDAHGNPLSLKDNTNIQIEMFIIAPEVGPCWLHLNGISALGQYSFSNSAGNGLYFIRGIPSRVSMNVSIMAYQTQAMVVISRTNGSAFSNVYAISATLPVYSGGLVTTPITYLRFTGVFLSGTKIRITKC